MAQAPRPGLSSPHVVIHMGGTHGDHGFSPPSGGVLPAAFRILLRRGARQSSAAQGRRVSPKSPEVRVRPPPRRSFGHRLRRAPGGSALNSPGLTSGPAAGTSDRPVSSWGQRCGRSLCLGRASTSVTIPAKKKCCRHRRRGDPPRSSAIRRGRSLSGARARKIGNAPIARADGGIFLTARPYAAALSGSFRACAWISVSRTGFGRIAFFAVQHRPT
jgi:hypothetical protein